MQVPFVDLKAQYRAIQPEIDSAIAEVISNTAFISGKYARIFEQAFAGYIGVAHCVGAGNGTDALYLALKSLGIGAGDEVITAANTFIATSEAITRTGAGVVFVDCEENYYNIDPALIEAAITNRTKAIVPVHLYGQPADMEPILEIARTHDLYVIEDAAQAHGATYKGRRVGTMGHCACFSFYPGKNLGAYGDAGAIVTNDEKLTRQMRMYGDHGSEKKHTHEFEGDNSRLDGIQAAVLTVKLKHLDKWNDRRIEVATLYQKNLQGVVGTPTVREDVRHVFHLYVVRVKNRDEVMQHLSEHGIGCGIHYPIALPFQPAYAHLDLRAENFPVSRAIMDEIVSLPMHGDLTDEHVDFVISELTKVAKW